MNKLLAMFAAYNAWANTVLYDAASKLSFQEYNRDVGAFFKSMNGTLNHILVADRIWMRRFTGEGEQPRQLDMILFDEFDELWVARKAEDRRIIRYISRLEPSDLLSALAYTPISTPDPVTQRLSPAISHFFNHQTHHRGQAHMILSILGRTPPPLDLLFFQRSEEGKQYS